MINQRTRTEVAYAYGFRQKSMFLELLETEAINLPNRKLLSQDTQISLYARLGIPKGLERKEKIALLPLIKAYRTKHDLPAEVGFLLPKTRAEVASAYGYNCTKTFMRYLEKSNICLPSRKLLDHYTQIELYAQMGVPKGFAADEIATATAAVKKYCQEQDLPPPKYYKILNVSKILSFCPKFMRFVQNLYLHYSLFTCNFVVLILAIRFFIWY